VIGVLLADDQELVRDGLRTIIDTQDDMEVVGEASDGREAVRLARLRRPDVVVMDVRMPGELGRDPSANEPSRRVRFGPCSPSASKPSHGAEILGRAPGPAAYGGRIAG
jgi:hypothetical protein